MKRSSHFQDIPKYHCQPPLTHLLSTHKRSIWFGQADFSKQCLHFWLSVNSSACRHLGTDRLGYNTPRQLPALTNCIGFKFSLKKAQKALCTPTHVITGISLFNHVKCNQRHIEGQQAPHILVLLIPRATQSRKLLSRKSAACQYVELINIII